MSAAKNESETLMAGHVVQQDLNLVSYASHNQVRASHTMLAMPLKAATTSWDAVAHAGQKEARLPLGRVCHCYTAVHLSPAAQQLYCINRAPSVIERKLVRLSVSRHIVTTMVPTLSWREHMGVIALDTALPEDLQFASGHR